MARLRKSALAFDAITLEGSLISPAKLSEVAERRASEQAEADYHIPKGLTLRDETARYFRIAQALYRDLFTSPNPSQSSTIRFAHELLRDVLGFADTQTVVGPKLKDGRNYIVHLEALQGRVPVVVVPPSDDLDHASSHLSHDRRRSAAISLQDWLNADDNSLWGFCCNGERLRLLRDNQSLTRPAYIEANLRQLFEAEDFAGFAALWLMLHSSRFGRPGAPASDCALERWREAGNNEGLAAREQLSVGVKDALLTLGNGFLAHPTNSALRDCLAQGKLPLAEFFNELLRVVYRLIFLLVAEDRDLLHLPNATPDQRKLYAQGYSVSSLRDRSIRRSGWDGFHDRWEGLLIVFESLVEGEPRLGLPGLGGLFDGEATKDINQARLANRALMEAIFRLAWLRTDSTLMPVNWRDMETEELGSVYEGLLELTPRLTTDGRGFAFAEGVETKGNERKKTGSYYTPDSLVQALLDSALDPVLDRVENEADDAPGALLGLSVIDPACGSGHFLLAAARRIATRVARLRTGGVPSAADYRHALRDAVRCTIHGVDRNPMAIELARVALWIETVEPGKPLGFLDANLRVGDSLLGIFDLKALEKGIPDAAYKPLTGDHRPTANDFKERNKRDKGEVSGLLDFSGSTTNHQSELPRLAASMRAVRQLPEDTVEQIHSKQQQYRSAHGDPHLTNLEQAADLYIAAFLTPKTEAQSLDLHTALVPTTADVWAAMRSGTVYGPRLGAARKLASDACAFHWPIEFPDVMNAGGFDVVLGNPPWERIKIQEQEFFASREPEIAEAPNAAARGRMIEQLKQAESGTRERLLFEEFDFTKRIAEASSELVRVSEDDGGRFPLSGRGDVNTYALFAELFARLTEVKGRSGVIVPTGIATDATTAPFFAWLVKSRRLARLVDFENRTGLFPAVDSRIKFSLLTLGQNEGAASFAFFLTDAAQLANPERNFTLTPETIALFNPNTKTAPVFRSRVDAELTAKIYAHSQVLIDEAKGAAGNPWRFEYMTKMFDMADSSHLFRTAAQLSALGYARAGTDWLPGENRGGDRYIPLFEAKMAHQFDHRWAGYGTGDEATDCDDVLKSSPDFEAAPRYWISARLKAERAASKSWTHDWLMGWRDIARATDDRTLIAVTVPNVAVNHKIRLFFLPYPADFHTAFIGNLNALTVDYLARQKVGGTTLALFMLAQLPLLPPEFYLPDRRAFTTPRVLELCYTSHSLAPFARDLGYDGPPFPWNEDRRALLRAELDAWYARAYGLTRDELRYILDPADVMGPDYPSETFRVLKNNETKKYGEYRTRRLVLEAWDRMEAGDLPAPVPYDRNAMALEPAVAGVNPLFGSGPLFEVPEAAPVKPPTRISIDPYRLPAKHWEAASSLPTYTVTQLAAIVHRLTGPTPISQVRLASLFALEPHLLTRRLQGSERDVWLRLVGDAAKTPNAKNVVPFAPKINAAWGKAVTQLRGMGEIDEDLDAGTWAEGSPTSQYQIPEWADGRADFVLKAIADISLEVLTADLSSEDRAWVNLANVA